MSHLIGFIKVRLMCSETDFVSDMRAFGVSETNGPKALIKRKIDDEI
jgi:hypothetical protein